VTVWGPVWAMNPTTSAANVRNVGAVKQAWNRLSKVMSEAGRLPSGGISGPLPWSWSCHR
jgi:hypothetical protein